MNGFEAWLGVVVLSGVLVVLIVTLMRGPMHRLLTANATIAPASVFYLRAFVLVMVLAALAAVAGSGTPCEKQAENTMTLVWWAAERLQSAFLSVGGFLMAFVLLLTVLFAALGRYRDQ